MFSEVDVAVLGGGPAGLATALRLARVGPGISVAVLERSAERRPRIGETVPPQIRPVLEELGAWESFAAGGHLAGWGTAASWGSDKVSYNDFIFRAGGPGWHLDRARFEADLEAEAQARGIPVLRGVGVELIDRQDKPAGPGQPTGGWTLALCRPEAAERPDIPASPASLHILAALELVGGEGRLAARIVVDATGRRAAFARRRGARRLRFDALAGAYAFLRRSRETPIETGFSLVEATEEGWWYTAALPGERMVACFVTDADRVRELELGREAGWRAQAARSPHTARRLTGTALLSPPGVQPADSALLDPIAGEGAGEGWLAVGDAAASFDPLSSRGIVTALSSGIRAADAIREALAGNGEALAEYARQTRLDLERYLATREGYYGLERRWPDAPFWSRRQGRVTLDPRARCSRPVRSGGAAEGAAGAPVEEQSARAPSPRGLGPVADLYPASAGLDGGEAPGMHLPAADRALLLGLCGSPRPAHELVAAFRERRPGAYSDRRLVLALQHLVETGAMAQES